MSSPSINAAPKTILVDHTTLSQSPLYPYNLYSDSNNSFFSYSNKSFNVKLAYQLFQNAANTTIDDTAIPVILLGGSSLVKEDWNEYPYELSIDRRVIIVDYRGIGRSEYTGTEPNPDEYMPAQYIIEDMAEDIYQLSKFLFPHLNCSKAHYIGISRGGLILQTLLGKHPEIMQSALLGCTESVGRGSFATPASAPKNDWNALKKFWAQWVLTDDWVNANKAKFELLYKISQSRNKPDMTVAMQRYAAADYKANKSQFIGLESIVPIELFHGDKDRMITMQDAIELHQLMNNDYKSPFKLNIIKNAGHNLWITHMTELLTLSREFFNKHEKSSV